MQQLRMAVTFGTNDFPCTSSTDVFSLLGEPEPDALAPKSAVWTVRRWRISVCHQTR